MFLHVLQGHIHSLCVKTDHYNQLIKQETLPKCCFSLHFGCVEQLNLRRQSKVPVSVSDSCACSSQQPHPPTAVCSTLCDSIQPVPLSLTLDVAADDHSRSLSPPSLSLRRSLHNKVHAPAW